VPYISFMAGGLAFRHGWSSLVWAGLGMNREKKRLDKAIAQPPLWPSTLPANNTSSRSHLFTPVHILWLLSIFCSSQCVLQLHNVAICRPRAYAQFCWDSTPLSQTKSSHYILESSNSLQSPFCLSRRSSIHSCQLAAPLSPALAATLYPPPSFHCLVSTLAPDQDSLWTFHAILAQDKKVSQRWTEATS